MTATVILSRAIVFRDFFRDYDVDSFLYLDRGQPVETWYIPSHFKAKVQQWMTTQLKGTWRFGWVNPSKDFITCVGFKSITAEVEVNAADFAVEFDNDDDAALFKMFWL